MGEYDLLGTKAYFDRVPREWDAYYSHEDPFRFRINQLLRPGLYERYAFAFSSCGSLEGATVLDIGCGSGRYSIESAKRGARRVVGIDFAPNMISFSRGLAKEMDVADRCEFVYVNFLEHTFTERFDVVFALGLFDYVADPLIMFRKIAALEPRVFVGSFPRFTPLWGIQRHIRYNWIRNCPIYNYRREQLELLFRKTPFAWYNIVQKSRGYFCTAGVRDHTK